MRSPRLRVRTLILAVAIVALVLWAARGWQRAPLCWSMADRLQRQASELAMQASWAEKHPAWYTAGEAVALRGRAESLAGEARHYRRAAFLPWVAIP